MAILSSTRKPWLFLTALTLLSFKLIMASDTISLNQSISGNQTIVSQGGQFKLGFFTPGKNTNNYYIGIWYNQLPGQTVVWVANRDKPITNTSTAELKISKNGALVLVDTSSNTEVWSSSSNASNATVVVLEDTANLVLKDRLNSSVVLWQSFDHPTDTWMPGGWIGVNKVTGEYQSITSWKNPENPARGMFSESMGLDGSNQFVFLWNVSEVYWSSGLWNGDYFTAVPSTKEKTMFNFTFTDNPDRKFAMYTMIYDTTTRFVMGSDGQGRQFMWLYGAWQTIFTQPLSHCDVYSVCGSFGMCSQKGSALCQCLPGFTPVSANEWNLSDWSSGCLRITKLQCFTNSSTEAKDGFLKMSNVNLPVNPDRVVPMNEKECEDECLNNCSCNAYSYDGSCSMWHSDLRNLQSLGDGNSSGSVVFLRLAASDVLKYSSTSSKSNKLVIKVAVGAAAGFLVVLCCLLALLFESRRRKRVRIQKQTEGHSLIQFSYSDLQNITKGFSDTLGSGGFGSVFKGKLADSTEVAVKKLEGLRQGEKQFRAEVSTLGNVQHTNLVRLRGFCCEGSKRLLVYEFMPGGSLDSKLSDTKTESSNVLDWKTRYQIILGVARGLTYLHEQCRECIVHCDIKPENILLDSQLCAKVADFGMAKLIGHDISRVLTTMRGTVGYLAPEWIGGLPITPKVDIFSVGMMLLEIVSGRRNAKHESEEKNPQFYYPVWASKHISQGNIQELLDERVDYGEVDAVEFTRVCRVACWCIQGSEAQRPTMGQVVQILEGNLDVNVPPFPSTLETLADDYPSSIGDSGFYNSSNSSSITPR